MQIYQQLAAQHTHTHTHTHTLTDDKLIINFDLENLDPKTEYQVADVEVIGKTDFFSSEGILDLNARFTTSFQKVKIIGANFEKISQTEAQASLYFDPNFNRYLNDKRFNAIFVSEDDPSEQIKSVPISPTSDQQEYSTVLNNSIQFKLTNLKSGKKYIFSKLESAPEQDSILEQLVYKNIELNQESDNLPYFYTSTDIASILAQPTQDSAKVVVNFTTKDPNFKTRTNLSNKSATIFLKNNATGAFASAQANEIKFENGTNKVEFDIKNLDKLSHYTITEILVDSEKINFSESLKEEQAQGRNFWTVAQTASVIKAIQTEKKHDKIGLELSFDPIKDTFLKGDTIKVVLLNTANQKTIEASGTVDQNLVLKLNFDSNLEAGSEYSIQSITNTTKDKDIQTLVGFLLEKKVDNYSPNLEKTSIDSEKFYSSPELKSFEVTSNKNETVNVKLTFADAQKLLLEQVSGQQKQLTLLLKNTASQAIVAAQAKASEKNSKIEAEFTFSNLDRATKYELVSVNDYSRPDYQIYKDNNNFTNENSNSFVVNVDSIEVKNLVYSDIKQDSVKAEIYFDPIRDPYLANKEIEIQIQKDNDPVAQLVSVQALDSVRSDNSTKQKVSIQKLDDGRLKAEVVFNNLSEGSDFKISLLSLANKSEVKTNAENAQNGPKFKIVNDFLNQAQGQSRAAEISADSNQKTLKFATDVVVSKIEFNPEGSNVTDKQQSAKIKIEFSNSNNEILKLKNDQLATLTLINKQTGKLVLASARIQASESGPGQAPQTSALVEFDFNNNLEKLTKYEVSSIQVVRPNGIYSIPFSTNIQEEQKSFITQLNTISVKNISYVDVSNTSVEITTFFDSINDNILNDQFEAELEYVLKTKDTELKKSSKVTVSNNQAIFSIDGLDEASTYEIKDLKLTKKTQTRTTRSLRARRSAPQTSQVANNISVQFDKTEVEDKQKKLFSTKSLISEITIDKSLLEEKLTATQPALTLDQTNLTDTQAGIELKIKDPKQFFKDYNVNGIKSADAASDIKLVVKSTRTGAIAQAGAQITFDETKNEATVKFLLEDLEKYTVYSIVDIFVSGVRLGFLNSLTEEQKKFATTARDVTPDYIAQTEFKRHGAVLRMVFDINKNWFLVNNKVRLTFKKFQDAAPDDPDLSAEAIVDKDGLAVFQIKKDEIADKVPVGTRFEISKLEFDPEVNSNQQIVQYFPLKTITPTDTTKTHSAIQASNLVPLARSRRSVSVFDDSSSGVSSSQDDSQASDSAASPTPAASPADSQVATLANTNFLDVRISTTPLQDLTTASLPTQGVKSTFDTASFISAVEKVNLSGTNAELKITLNSTLLLDVQSPTIKLKYIDITDGKEHIADLVGNPTQNQTTSEYTFSATNLKTLNYYQIVSVIYQDNQGAQQSLAFDDQLVKYEDKLFRTTPTSFSVKKIESNYNSKNKTANVKITLDEQVAQYLENYTVKVSYQRIDKTNANVTTSTVDGIINSDSTVSVVFEDNYTDLNQKTLSFPNANTTSNSINEETNTISSEIQNPETSITNQQQTIDNSKLFETYNYKITKVELVQKPTQTSQRRARRALTTTDLVDFNKSFAQSATFETTQLQGGTAQASPINETQIIKTIPISLYDQLIYVQEKDKSSGIDAKIYAYFVSSEELSDQETDKQNFKVQLYNKSLKKYEFITRAESIKKISAQNNKSHFYVVTFSTNLNKASLYNIEFFAYKDQKIELSEYKTNRVEKTEFTTPGQKAWLTNFSQVGAYQDQAANVIIQFDEKDEYLWRNKHKIELEITEKVDTTLNQTAAAGTAAAGGQPQTPQTSKFTFIPSGPISRVRIDNNSSKGQTNEANLAPNKTYEITKFTIKEADSSPQGIQTPVSSLSTLQPSLKIKTIDAQNTVNPTTLGVGQMEVDKVDLAEVENSPKDQKIPFFETKAQFSYTEATNFIQDDDKDANGKSANLKFKFNKHFLQIPDSFATITIAPTDSTVAATSAPAPAPGTGASNSSNTNKEISFTSNSKYNPTTGEVEFRLTNLDRFHTYQIKNFEIGGVKISNLGTSTNLEFTPVVQKIFLSDIEVEDLRTGTNEAPASSPTPAATAAPAAGSAPATNSTPTLPQKEDGSKVFGKVKLYFDKDDSWLKDSKFEVTVKDKNKNTELVKISDLQVTEEKSKPSTPYQIEIDLNKKGKNRIEPGQKIAFEFKIQEVDNKINLKSQHPENIVIEVPERQYNLEYAPILESDIIIPPVIESFVVSNLTDTSARLKIKLKGDPANFERVVSNPIVLSIQPDPKGETSTKIPISLINQSQVTTFKDKTKFEIEYDLENLIPNVEYKILKLQGQDLEIPFGEQDYKLRLEQNQPSGSGQTEASSTEKTFKTPFTELSPERIILTQAARAASTTSGRQEYSPENLTLNLDPVSMWSLNNKTIKVKLKPVGPDGKDLTEGDNSREKEYDFRVTYNKSKKALVAQLNKQVTDNADGNLYPSTTYKITQIKTQDNQVPNITLNLDQNTTDANNLQFTTQLAQPPLEKVWITNFYNHSGKEDTFEQTIYFAFDDPYRAIDESSIKDWKLILEGTTSDTASPTNWEQVVKYEPESASSNGIVLFDPRELAAPDIEYTEKPELQRLLIEQDNLEKQIALIDDRIKNFDEQDQRRIDLIKKLADEKFKEEYVQILQREGEEIKKEIETQKAELEKLKNRLKQIKVYSAYEKEVEKLNEQNQNLTTDHPYRRYFAFNLKGDASWLKYYKMRVAIQYKYFKDNDNRKHSDFSKLITATNVKQSANRNSSAEAYSSQSSQNSSSASRIEKIELTDFAKYTNRVLLKKSEIKPLNQIGAYIEMEFDDPKGLLAPLKGKFDKANFTSNDDINEWIKLSSNIRFDIQAGVIKNPGSTNIKSIYKVDATNDDGSSVWSQPSNQWKANNSNFYNLDFGVKVYDYNLNNPFSSLLTNASQEYIDLVKTVPKILHPETTLRENEMGKKLYALRLAKFEVNDSTAGSNNKTVKVGLIITYHHSAPEDFTKKIISIYPKILANFLNKAEDVKNFEPLVPSLSKNINLTFMTSPIIKKEDPYWGNFWANANSDVWYSSEIRQFDIDKQKTQIINAFENSLVQKIRNNFKDDRDFKEAETLFIGPTSPIKTLGDNPTKADDNDPIQQNVRNRKQGNQLIKDIVRKKFFHGKKDKDPFGIKSTKYEKSTKIFTVTFENPYNKSINRIQEIMPTVSYAVFIDQGGKIYLFGNKNGNPIRLQDDINIDSANSTKNLTLDINLAPATWDENDLPAENTNLNFMGILVFPYLPTNFLQNKFLSKNIGETHYVKEQQYTEVSRNGTPHQYLLPVKGYQGLRVDAQNPYFIPWTKHDNAWERLVY
ncbi:hypothetical protein R7W54_02805 [Mesomycoplasma ovipneumoniae]|uniref:DUF1410 domain-containing protein n=1 Tax=Mesomycoplasma ovipneumoniae TaxID=29562 RepID=A0AAJ2P5G7_9BACT|nr:hypothetical protein [Mesomycoplasma ovipneumoniae]MDW2892892.1 hypothetical protein [Mesomycoplasma ovipneumoniae]